MAFDASLADRVRYALAGRASVTERKMFGGLVFMIRGHMLVGVDSSSLMARIGPDVYEQALGLPHVSAEVFGTHPAKGYVMVRPDGLLTDGQLRGWIDLCCTFIESLPDKKPCKSAKPKTTSKRKRTGKSDPKS